MEGKAKEALLNFLKQNHWTDYVLYVESQKPISNELIIDYLDSVGIYITIDFTKPYWYVIIIPSNGVGNYVMDENGFLSRQEATEAAIKKAVEIFNEKYK
ncbi:hypothetical protein CMU21_15780 [Elizabethkingia anophelis]|nr:hypothetical protein [Elizabethkingia anophelis]